MAIYRNIYISFWEDTKVLDDMTPEDRYFMLYLLSNPHTNQTGCFEISCRQMSNETGYNIETIEKLLKKFEENLKIIMYSKETKEILIVNWHKYNWTTSPKVKTNILKELKNIKNEKFIQYIYGILKNKYGMHTDAQQEQEQKQEQEKEQERKQKQEQLDSCDDEVVVENNIFKFYEENIGLITPYSKEILLKYKDKFNADIIIYAMKIAIEQNKKNIAYIKGILNNWEKSNIKTLIEAKDHNRSFNQKSKIEECMKRRYQNYAQREYGDNLNNLYANINKEV